MAEAGPLKSAFESDTTGVVMQELVTYRVRNGMLVKETTTRQFSDRDHDYYDSQSIQPLHTVTENV